MKGWECPKCGRCYSPIVRECDFCNQISELNKMSQKPLTDPFIGTGRCLACNGFHPQGMACPTWTVTSEGE